MSDFAKQVEQYRKRRGLSQGGLASEVGVNQATISRIERGEAEPAKAVRKLLERMMADVA